MAGWFEPLTVQQQMQADYQMDAAVGMAPERRPVRATVQRRLKVSRAQFNEFAADEYRQYKNRRIADIKRRNIKKGQ